MSLKIFSFYRFIFWLKRNIINSSRLKKYWYVFQYFSMPSPLLSSDCKLSWFWLLLMFLIIQLEIDGPYAWVLVFLCLLQYLITCWCSAIRFVIIKQVVQLYAKISCWKTGLIHEQGQCRLQPSEWSSWRLVCENPSMSAHMWI